jgi:hypothetical protein
MDTTEYTGASFIINKTNLADARWVEQPPMSLDTGLSTGQIALAVDGVGLSSNNITYALTGDSVGYWDFFPHAEEGYGIMPVWGFADVVSSKHDDIKVGQRVFGFFPAATHWVMTPSKVTREGFIDVHPGRKSNAPVYDSYLFTAADKVYDPEREVWQANFRPLFLTSFVLAEFVAAQTKHQRTTVLLTSASSKTAYGCAFLLNALPNVEVIGLTSEHNVEFVQDLGCYDEIVEYTDVHNMRYRNPVWILDFAGNKALLQNLQEILDSYHQHTAFIGVTDVAAQRNKPSGKLKGSVFFAPEHVKQLTHLLGRELFLAKYFDAWYRVAVALNPLLEQVDVDGQEAFLRQYQTLLAGDIDPRKLLWCHFK